MSADDLTPRQREVCIMAGKGLTYQEIADELGLSYRTVTYHAQNAAERLPGDQRPMQKLILHGTRLAS